MSLRVMETRVVGPNASADWEDAGEEWHLRVSLHNRSATYVLGKVLPPQDGPDGTVVIARTRVSSSGDYLEVRVDRGADPTVLPWPQVGLALLPLPPPY